MVGLGDSAPGYGYVIAEHPATGKTIVLDDYAAGIIREIARLCAGESVTGIVHSLNERGKLRITRGVGAP